MLVIGTTSEVSFLESVGVCDAFSVTYHVPTLKTEDAKKASFIVTSFFMFIVFNVSISLVDLNLCVFRYCNNSMCSRKMMLMLLLRL